MYFVKVLFKKYVTQEEREKVSRKEVSQGGSGVIKKVISLR